MESDQILLYVIIGVVSLLIIVWISYEVIYASGYGRKNWVEARKQTKLLTEIAKKNGIEGDKIDEILDEGQYKINQSPS